MKLSRQYLLGLGSGLILSALIALLFTPLITKTPSRVGTTNTTVEGSPAETSSHVATSPNSEMPVPSTQEAPSSEKSVPEEKSQTSKSFVISPGASADQIAQLLQNEGWIQNKNDFLAIVKAQKLEKRFKAGTYNLTPGLSIENMINQLIH